MKAFLRAQLERYTQRLAELDFLLSREDIMKNMQSFMALSREHTEVGAVAERYQQHQQRQADAQAAAGLLTHEDADMRALGQEEAAQANQDMARLEAELQRMLLPKDPEDERAAYLEIRAGTGGDESALFAGDLLRMYTRCAERRGWRVSLNSGSPSDLGGYKEVVLRVEGDQAYGWLRLELSLIHI